MLTAKGVDRVLTVC